MCNDASRALAIACMLLAARSKDQDGTFNGDPEYVKRFGYLNGKPDFNPLIQYGFIEVVQDASNALAPCITEKSREETETETEKDNFTSTLPAKIEMTPARSVERLNGRRVMVEQVVTYLNHQARRNYRVTNPNGTYTAHAEIIAQRLKEGYTVEQLKDVIGHKSGQWMGDEKMDQYLNPSTLFRKGNFTKYLAESEAV